jgi:hypothetical protein
VLSATSGIYAMGNWPSVRLSGVALGVTLPAARDWFKRIKKPEKKTQHAAILKAVN